MTPRRAGPKLLLACLLGGLVLLGLTALGLALHGVRRGLTLQISGPLPRPGEFPHRLLDAALRRAVTDSGLVDYGLLNQEPGELESYVTHLARVSPLDQPQLFPTRGDSLAYWLNAYNAFVLTLVRDHYPLDALSELDNPAGLTPGAAFWLRRFNTGGHWLCLGEIEAWQIRHRFRDPRVHFALSCATLSCPALPRAAFRPAQLDADLDDAVRRFLASPRGFQLDSAAHVVRLSALFRWYGGEFRADLPHDMPIERRVGDRALLAWVEPYLAESVARRLQAGTPWRVEYLRWDGRLNAARGP